jgi:hypothetical protein
MKSGEPAARNSSPSQKEETSESVAIFSALIAFIIEFGQRKPGFLCDQGSNG